MFQYKVNKVVFLDKNLPFDSFGLNFCENNDFITYYNLDIKFKCNLFKAFNTVNNILNNIVFFVLSVCIDMCLIQFTNRNLARKVKLFSISESLALQQAIKLKEKASKLTLFNGMLYFISHIPDFVVSILLLIYGEKMSNFCFSLFSCVELLQIMQSFNFFSLAFQFFIFKKFDKNFSDSFNDLMARFMKKMNC